jgi:hypothetical protein
MKNKIKLLLFFAIFSFAFAKNVVAAVPSHNTLRGISLPSDSSFVVEKQEFVLAQKETRELIQQARLFANLSFASLLLLVLGVVLFSTGALFILAILAGLVFSIMSIVKLVKIQRYFNQYKDLSKGNNLREIFTLAIVRTVLSSVFLGLLFLLFLLVALIFGFDGSDIFSSSITTSSVGVLGVLLLLLLDFKQFKTKKKMNKK